MTCRMGVLLCLLSGLVVNKTLATPPAPAAIVCDKGYTPLEKLAAKEVRRYIYLRTGKVLPIVLPDGEATLPKASLIVVSTKDHLTAISTQPDAETAKLIAEIKSLAPQQFLLKTWTHGDRTTLLVVGGDPIGTLYGAYRLAECLGARFYLHGDVLPDKQIPLDMPQLNETGKPLFELRGINPFHDFPEGPDWWNRDTYKAILGQMPKMGMNFIGMHCYPECNSACNVGSEPLVWIGPADEIAPNGKVKASYPSRHYTTASANGAWGSQPVKTSDYAFGAAELFDCDNYGADYMRGLPPWSPGTTDPSHQMSPEQCNLVFDRVGESLNDVFTYGRRLGIKTVIGTELPLIIPAPVKQRLLAAGKKPDDPAVVQEIYEGMFQRIAKTHSLDYYWLWTNEGWTWSPVTQAQIDEVMANFHAADAAAKKVKAPFTLATSGWVLGPPQSPALFDNSLPKEMPMACINRQVGNTPIEPGFAQIAGRPKWAIPWLEDDPGMTIPQLWAGRMRRDAADALEYGCTGLMGIHWRTRVLSPNVAALAKAAWDQTGWNKDMKTAGKTDVKVPEGVDGGQTAEFPNTHFVDADHDAVYQTVRYGMKAYHLDIPNGTYNVTLKLCEPAHAEKGKRVFGAKVQGKTLFEHLDMFAAVGKDRAIDKTANNVKVTDGRLTIQFVAETEFPCIAGIVIDGKTVASNQFPARPYTRKINCGGPVFQDYQAELALTGAAAKPRYSPVADFYADWACAEFGPKAAERTAALFTRLDGHLPRPADWVTGPGSIRPDPRPWEEARTEYAFVDEMEALRPTVEGAGNLERYEYWLDNFRYLRAIAEVRCVWARFNAAMEKVKAEKNLDAQKKLARDLALPIRKELVTAFAHLHRHLLATVSNPGEMGNVCNWQQQTMPVLLTAPGEELAKLLGEALPADATPSKEYVGPPRIFVREVRTGIVSGETLKLTVVVLGIKPERAELRWRPLGNGSFASVPLTHVARGVYTVTLPADAVKADFEYYVQASVGPRLIQFPATGASLPQTVIVE
jgi:hypothetical protein